MTKLIQTVSNLRKTVVRVDLFKFEHNERKLVVVLLSKVSIIATLSLNIRYDEGLTLET